MHQLAEGETARLAEASATPCAFVSPRHLLELLRLTGTLIDEKAAELAGQLRHLGRGLDRLEETKGQVALLQAPLPDSLLRPLLCLPLCPPLCPLLRPLCPLL